MGATPCVTRAGLFLLFAALLLAPGPRAADALAAGDPPPDRLSLDGLWELVLDHGDRGLADGMQAPAHPGWSRSLSIAVPGALETRPETAGYDGVVWYRRRLPDSVLVPGPGERLLLEFDGANARADAWIDGRPLGRHDGSDARFAFDVTDLPDLGGAALIVRVVDPGTRTVDGLLLGSLPHAKESWYVNYGGLTGSVRLRRAPQVEVVAADVLPPAEGEEQGRLRVTLWDHAGTGGDVTLQAWLGDDPPDARSEGRLALSLPAGTRHALSLPLPVDASLPHWSPDAPHRVALHVVVTRSGVTHRRRLLTGLRRFEAREGRFELDGQVLRPWGVLYQPLYPGGLCRPPDPGFVRRELQAIKDAGFDLVRAHLRVMPEVYELCDELGLLVHAEPTLGWITAMRAHTLAAVDEALETFADEVAGHPSVVICGLLNELSGELAAHTDPLFARFGELLPHRLLIDDSGGWQGGARLRNPGGAPRPFQDVHLYRAWPWEDADVLHARTLGADRPGELVYVSEYGFGGIPDLAGAVAGFRGELWREDARAAQADLLAVTVALRDTALGQVARDVAQVSLLGQLDQARAARIMTAALQDNPQVAGAVYTQWRDVSWECGAGLVGTWGAPKPALDGLREQLGSVPPPTPRALRLPDPPGRTPTPLTAASLVDVDPALVDALTPFLAPARDAGRHLPRITIVGARPGMWGPDEIDQTVVLLNHVREGGVLLMLEPPDAGRPLPQFLFGYDGLGQVGDLPLDLTARAARGHFVGTHFAFRPGSRLLDDLPLPVPLLDERFGAVKPHVVLEAGPGVHSRAELLCVDGYGLPLGAAVQTVTFGKGRLVLSTLRFDEASLAEPAARRLLENLVRLAASEALALGLPDASEPRPSDASVADLLAQRLWRLRIAFGLWERETVQSFNGERSRRAPPKALAAAVSAKDRALLAALDGRMEQALSLVDQALARGLDPTREEFLRAELTLSQRFHEGADGPTPRTLQQTMTAGRAHARALRLLSLGEPEAGRRELEAATAVVEGWPRPARPDDDGSADGPDGR